MMVENLSFIALTVLLILFLPLVLLDKYIIVMKSLLEDVEEGIIEWCEGINLYSYLQIIGIDIDSFIHSQNDCCAKHYLKSARHLQLQAGAGKNHHIVALSVIILCILAYSAVVKEQPIHALGWCSQRVWLAGCWVSWGMVDQQ